MNKMNCGVVKRKIHQWLDGELGEREALEVDAHVQACSSCGREAEELRSFQALLRSAPASIEPSPRFEARFWGKALERERRPWFVRWLEGLEFSLPLPSLSQAAAALLLSFLIGGGGGIFLGIREGERGGAGFRSLSGFDELRGVPASSVAGAYFRAAGERRAS